MCEDLKAIKNRITLFYLCFETSNGADEDLSNHYVINCENLKLHWVRVLLMNNPTIQNDSLNTFL